MPPVQVFEDKKADQPLFTADFDFLPRSGDCVSRDAGGFFRYYDVIEVWHRESSDTGAYRACILVRLDD